MSTIIFGRMRRSYLALAAMLFLISCKEEEEAITVEFWANCASCIVTHGINDATLSTDSMGGTAVRRWYIPAFVGDEVFITAQPRVVSNDGTAIAVDFRGVQQEFKLVQPNTAALLDTTITIRLTMPELDRFGQPK